MNKTTGFVRSAIALCAAVVLLSTPLFAQESEDGSKKFETEITEALGTFPSFMKAMPEHLRASAWEWTKAVLSGESPIPAR